MLAGGDCSDDAEVLRCGQTAAVLGHRVMAPSTLGTFLRAFTFGHVRQLDRLTEQLLARAWAAGAGPGDGPMTMDLDSTVCPVHGYHKQGAADGSTRTLGYHPLLATRADSGEVLPRPPAHRPGQHPWGSETRSGALSSEEREPICHDGSYR
jgi:Transposase DDE domain group 1